MKPGGPTEKALRSSMQPLGIVEGEWDWQEEMMWPKKRPRSIFDGTPAGIPKFPVPIQPISLPLSLKGNVNQEHVPASTTKTPQGTPRPQETPRPGETQVAMGPVAAALPWLLRTAPAVITGEFLRRQIEDMMQKNEGALPPLLPTEPEPPTPPSERPNASMKPNREEFPATPPRAPKKRGNSAARSEPTIEIYPVPDDISTSGNIVKRKGNEATRKELERVRDYFISKGWEHEAGGREPESGEEIPEYWTPNPAKDFGGDGRRGGNYSDITFIMPNGRRVHIQSVDVNKDGKPTHRELENADRIRKRTGESVILVPKNAQLKKLGLPPD
jgi:hypothetical protein